MRRRWPPAGVLDLGGCSRHQRAIDDASTAYVLLLGLQQRLEMIGVV